MGEPHKQPTPEELQKGQDEALKKLEEIDKKALEEKEKLKNAIPPQKTPEELEAEKKQAEDAEAAKKKAEEDAAKAKTEAEQKAKEEEEKKKKEEEDKNKKPDENKESIDYKKKFVESQREAVKLYKNNVEVDKAVDEADKLPDPSDEEMKKIDPSYELMNDTEKKLAKDNELNKRRFELIRKATKVTKDVQAWNDKVDKWVTDPEVLIKHPELEGKEDDFKLYATDKSYIGSNFDLLLSAFKNDVLSKAQKPKNSQMFETGQGGDKNKPKPKTDKISLDQARIMMTEDYKKYSEYVRAGKIDLSEI